MIRFLWTYIFCLSLCFVSAQKFEAGAWGGIANYFGDLNNNTSFTMARPAGGAFLRVNFNTRFALRGSFNFGQVAFDDKQSPFAFNRQRNLHFKSNIGEIGAVVEFNFLDFDKTKKDKRFTPYLATGFMAFYYNPQAELNGKWYYLQTIGTEGQNDPSFSGIERYKVVNFAIPVEMGLKFSLTQNWNVGLMVGWRKTFTDYLDDVSGVYPSPLSLPEGTQGVAYLLSDRSGEVGESIGEQGKQRGTSSKNDDYLFAGITVSYTFFKLKCPSPGRF